MNEEEKKDLKELSDKFCQEVAQDLLDSGIFEAFEEKEVEHEQQIEEVSRG